MYIKVKDNNDLVRDANNKALLNTDNEALNQYKARRHKEKIIEDVVNKYSALQAEVLEIKQLLRSFIEKK